MSDEEYHRIIASVRETCGKNGIDKTLDDNAIDLIIGPGDGPMFCIAGAAGQSAPPLRPQYSKGGDGSR
jgi:amidase